ncbi:MAG: hypothetical protein VX346_06355 [Planctomycetota bacterium]|nr:hypothetical protein [Planctomycetota bacterium]
MVRSGSTDVRQPKAGGLARLLVRIICRTGKHLSQKWHDRVCYGLSRVSPRAGFHCSSQIGRMAARLRLQGITARDVETILGPLPAQRCLAIAQTISATTWMQRIHRRLVWRVGYDWLCRHIVSHSSDHFQRMNSDKKPTILLFMHSGPFLAIVATLHQLKIPALVMTRGQYHPGSTTLQRCTVPIADPSCRSAAFKCALEKLRSGGIVMWGLDGAHKGSQVDVPLFGRSYTFARGPFAAARLTDATLVPVTASWMSRGRFGVWANREARLSTRSGLPPRYSKHEGMAVDQARAVETATWFEGHYRKHPEEIPRDVIRDLLLGEVSIR